EPSDREDSMPRGPLAGERSRNRALGARTRGRSSRRARQGPHRLRGERSLYGTPAPARDREGMSSPGGGGAAEDRFGIVGRVIAGAYHVERVVAEGGFGIVYRAQHGGFRAPIALKCLKVPQHLGAEHQARFLEQFRAEAEVMFRLSASTPNVVRPLHVDVMTTPNGAFVPFLVLEWLEGETLDSIIRGRRAQHKAPLALGEVMRLLEPVAHALDRAHHFDG